MTSQTDFGKTTQAIHAGETLKTPPKKVEPHYYHPSIKTARSGSQPRLNAQKHSEMKRAVTSTPVGAIQRRRY